MTQRVRRVIATAMLATVALVATVPGIAAAASSRQTQPRIGYGMIDMVERACGSPYGWERNARDNGVAPPEYIVYADRSYSITCYKPGTASTASTSTSKPARPTGYVGLMSRAPVSSSGWTHPLPGSWCSGDWGDPRAGHLHQGVDLMRGTGAPIYAAAAGTVTLIKYSGGAGWYVVVDHGRYNTVYMHNREKTWLVRVGQRVRAGQAIAFVGETGDATAPHLHFEVHDGAWHPIPAGNFMRQHGVNVGSSCH